MNAVKLEFLTGLGNPPRFMEHQASDGRGRLIRQIPAEFAVEVADRHLTVDQQAAVALRPHPVDGDIVLVGDIADDLLDDILQRDDPHEGAILIDHHREMLAPVAKGLQLVEQTRGFRHEPWLIGQIVDRQFGDFRVAFIA